MVDELDLFGGEDESGRVPPPSEDAPSGHGEQITGPLAARMRPRSLEEVRGQGHLLGEGKPLRAMLTGRGLTSMILWGPPGSGKTTLARLLAQRGDATFVPFSAVTGGVGRVREIVAEAKARQMATGRSTILFCDEIHRFNRAQQDAFLPHVENGTVILVGATTENPSFEINRPLLSRAPVFVLEPLSPGDLRGVLDAALLDHDRGLGSLDLTVTAEGADVLVEVADGDARRLLNALEAAAELVGMGGAIDVAVAREALQHRFAHYDKGGEEHFNLISALHKSIRGSDPDAALYWLARMLEGGEDPRYLARRLIRMASEDIGMAAPAALATALAGWRAYEFLGSPEGDLALAEVAVYLATAPKSNRLYRAWGAWRERARETPGEPVPLHIRNAPTGLMEELGYGEGYRYDPDEPEGVASQEYLPPAVAKEKLFMPGEEGYEQEVAERMRRWEEIRRGERGAGPSAPPEGGRESGGEAPRADSEER